MYTNNINKKQIEMVEQAERGEIELPKSSKELADIIRNALLVRDHESIEEEFLIKSKVAFIKTYARLSRDLQRLGSDDPEMVYTSQVLNVIKHRKYYQTLRAMCNQRGANVSNVILQSLIEDGFASRRGNQVNMNMMKADEYVESEHQK
ncbi:hypothetical protein NVP1087A_61 [Vibrio phage 1.087.A._10N.261.45.F9]|nr:hypothetical protein NVP1087A_61 [Vibrio phage 1.087.A._10N.261.45.F9]